MTTAPFGRSQFLAPGDPANGPQATFRVSVAKDYLTFSAAHFITIPDHKCESLHGHNYAVIVTAEGSVDRRTGFVVDFAVLKRILRPAIDEMDHRVLVPTRNERVRVRVNGPSTTVDYRGEARFVFPTSDVARIPVTDTTAELLAEHLAGHLIRGLSAEGIQGIRSLTVEVEESPGQCGVFSTSVESD